MVCEKCLVLLKKKSLNENPVPGIPTRILDTPFPPGIFLALRGRVFFALIMAKKIQCQNSKNAIIPAITFLKIII
jgi:hypothetical protein